MESSALRSAAEKVQHHETGSIQGTDVVELWWNPSSLSGLCSH